MVAAPGSSYARWPQRAFFELQKDSDLVPLQISIAKRAFFELQKVPAHFRRVSLHFKTSLATLKISIAKRAFFELQKEEGSD